MQVAAVDGTAELLRRVRALDESEVSIRLFEMLAKLDENYWRLVSDV